MICKICNDFESDSFRGLALHISNKHNIKPKEYYDKFLKQKTDGICIECGKPTNFKSLTVGYYHHCSIKCSNSSKKHVISMKQTKKERYGDENYVNAEKASHTWKSKSEIEYDEIFSKRKQTKKERYGDENYTNREQAKQTNLDENGDEYYTNREKYKQTCQDKYGVDNTFQLEEVKEKSKNTMVENYGVDHPMKISGMLDIMKEKSVTLYKSKIEKIFGEFFEVIEYEDYNNIKVRCKICQEEYWVQRQFLLWRYHKNINLCRKCYDLSNTSLSEKTLFDFIQKHYNGNIITNRRNLISPLELDIYLPDLKLAFEFNGIYWHSELYKDDTYHLNKTQLCELQGIHLIHIYEDDWMYHRAIVESRIKNLLGKSDEILVSTYDTHKVSFNDSNKFLLENHLQGGCPDKIRIGLYDKNEIVALMTFGELRTNLGQKSKDGSFELLRFCNKLNTNIIGSADKLYNLFLQEFNPIEVISYTDRSWTMNNGDTLYNIPGFKNIGETEPNYQYIVGDLRENRFKFRKDKLVKEGFDINKSEREIMLEREIYRIYNSGNLKYKYITN